MNEPFQLFPPLPDAGAPPAPDPQDSVRLKLLRGLLTLLLSGVFAFALTTWWLVRMENSPNAPGFRAEPASIVRRQLAALNQGDLRVAYQLFSNRYRQQVPFELYHELVVSHWPIFRTRDVQFRGREESPDRVVLDAEMLSSDGQRYIARFTLLRVNGRWWIDDVHWSGESRRGNLVAI